ncbi:hypothetical protein BAUCODRAFT_37959 [Baudoinia panamericana UAMH 10762]|uniref:Uncharacterized protein n=1 Tax=Baudoinia panamericana (strain UAMH 10762) TaxID=717646 RepID=M2LG76_BAUPA|nr:uncharacterized protein BAUCODRAFT_37959 [Baudoinia panamericana UAMH 10762]EMC93037.1 hypothetical protein BAUCODRAFT_37959 [Baudoinia panamericana UAMH 10762]
MVRTADGTVAGRIKFHHLTANSIDIIVNGRDLTLSSSYSLGHHRRWGFQSSVTGSCAERLYWKTDKVGSATLETAKFKHERAIAMVQGDLLSFRRGNFSRERYDEIVVTAIAAMEATRRQGKAGKGNAAESAAGRHR